MSRVSENSNTLTLNHALNKAKTKLEDLQLKGSSLKRIGKPSDDPTGNVQVLAYNSKKVDNDQFNNNLNYASTHLNFVENNLVELTEILSRAKELAIGQASDFYDINIRTGVAKEILQLKNQAMGIANKRIGNRHIFAGHATLTKPFDADGNYHGDNNKITVEIAKDFFVPINLSGIEVFFNSTNTHDKEVNPVKDFKELQNNLNPNEKKTEAQRSLASVGNETKANKSTGLDEELAKLNKSESIFGQLTSLASAMEANDPSSIQGLLDSLDRTMERVITLRTKVGAISNSINETRKGIDSDTLLLQERMSQLGDADVGEIFTDLNKQQQILKTTYKSGNNLINMSLLDFIR